MRAETLHGAAIGGLGDARWPSASSLWRAVLHLSAGRSARGVQEKRLRKRNDGEGGGGGKKLGPGGRQEGGELERRPAIPSAQAKRLREELGGDWRDGSFRRGGSGLPGGRARRTRIFWALMGGFGGDLGVIRGGGIII